MLVVLLLGVLSVSFLLIKVFFYNNEDDLDKLPGPPRLPFFGNTFEFFKIKPVNLFFYVANYTKLYGDRVAMKIFGIPMLNVTGPDDVEVVLSHSKNISKSIPYFFLKAWLGTGLLLSTGNKWHSRRKILTPAFHFKILKYFSKVIEEKSRDLVETLRKKEGSEVDLLPVISDFTLFTICETAMGFQLENDESESTVAYKNAILEIGKILVHRLTKVYLFYDFLFNISPSGSRFWKSVKIVQSFADNVIAEKIKQRKDNKGAVSNALEEEDYTSKKLALLDLLLEAEDKGEIDLEGVKDEVNTFMFEGHDTTAMALTFCLMLLADNEEVQERVYEECEQIFGDSGRAPTISDFAEMKYLEAVIKETLRLYPSVPVIGRRITEDFKLDDVLIKNGTEVVVHIYNIHRHPKLYTEPEKFDPERFLGNSSRHPYSFVPFSAGPRNCIGQRFAMLEMKCALSELCRAFRVVPREKNARPAIVVDMVMRPAEPIYVKFVPREIHTQI